MFVFVDILNKVTVPCESLNVGPCTRSVDRASGEIATLPIPQETVTDSNASTHGRCPADSDGLQEVN